MVIHTIVKRFKSRVRGRPDMISDGRGGGGVIKNLMKSDEGRRGVKQNLMSDLHFLEKRKKSRPLPNNKQTNKITHFIN